MDPSQPELTIASQYPFPIAFLFLHRVLEQPNPQLRAQGISITFENSLRFLCTVLLAEYRSGRITDSGFNQLVERLRRPCLGDLHAVAFEGTSRLRRRGHPFFVREMPDALRNLQRTRGLDGPQGQRRTLLQTLLVFRNEAQHRYYETDWATACDTHLPLLVRFLERLSFLVDYPLCRVVSERPLQAVELRGSSLEAPTWEPDSTPPGVVFLRSRERGPGLALSPFITIEPCQECIQSPGLLGLSEEVFLLNGEEGDAEICHFIGVRHNLVAAASPLSTSLHSHLTGPPDLPVDRLDPSQLLERAEALSRIYIDAQVRHGVYLPDLTVPRRDMEEELRLFLAGPKPGFLMLGESGIGKTTLLCHWTDEVLRAGRPCLYYAASDFDFSRLERQLMADLGLVGTLEALLERLQVPLILVFDAVNECSDPALAVRNLNNLVNAAPPDRLRVVFSVRTTHFHQILQALPHASLDPGGLSHFSADRYHTRRSDPGSRETYQHALARLDPDGPEMREMFERYRSRDCGQELSAPMRGTRPLTRFGQVSRQVRRLMTHPWFMRLVMETYDGREIPLRVVTMQLVNLYCQERIDAREETADLAGHLAKLMERNLTSSLKRSEIREQAGLQWYLTDSALGPSAYRRLVEDGVLLEVPESTEKGHFLHRRYSVRFSNDRILEFLIARRHASAGPLSIDRIQALLLTASAWPPHAGAAQALLCLETATDRGDLLLQCLDRCDPALFLPVLIPTLRTLEREASPAYETTLEHLCRRQTARDGLFLGHLAEGMALENGLEAAGRVYQALWSWQDAEAPQWRLVGGSGLLEILLSQNATREVVELHRTLQDLYVQHTKAVPNYLRTQDEQANLTDAQVARVHDLAFRCRQLASEMLNRGSAAAGIPGIVQRQLREAGLEWLPPDLKHGAARQVAEDIIGRILDQYPEIPEAIDRIRPPQEGQKPDPLGVYLACEDLGLDWPSLLISAAEPVAKEIAQDLGALRARTCILPAAEAEPHEVFRPIVLAYLASRAVPRARMDAGAPAPSLIGLHLQLAEIYRLRDDPVESRRQLQRALDYAEALEATPLLLDLHRAIRETEDHQEEGDIEARVYTLGYGLALSQFISLSPPQRAILLRTDFRQVISERLGVSQESVAELGRAHTILRLTPWLEPGECLEAHRLASLPGEQWRTYLAERAPVFERIFRETLVLDGAALLLRFNVLSSKGAEPNGLAALAEQLINSEPAESPSEWAESPPEWAESLEQIRSRWAGLDQGQRILLTLQSLVKGIDETSLHSLTDDREFCGALGMPPGTERTETWTRALIRAFLRKVDEGSSLETLKEALSRVAGWEIGAIQMPKMTLEALCIQWQALLIQQAATPSEWEGLLDVVASEDLIHEAVETLERLILSTGWNYVRCADAIRTEILTIHKTLVASFQ